MSSNKRDLKAYVRYDGSGRVVAGSLILRKKMPKVGKWIEIQTYECCNTTTTSTTTTNLNTILLYDLGEPISLNNPAVSMYCDAIQVDYGYVHLVGPYASIDAIVTALNLDVTTNIFGIFSNAGGGLIQLSVYPSVVAALCNVGELSFSIQED